MTSNTPQHFLVQAEYDGVRVEYSLFCYLALKNAEVPAHLFAGGDHGQGLRLTQAAVATWPERAEAWLRTLGVLETAKELKAADTGLSE